METKRFEQADEVRTPPKTKIEIVNISDQTMTKATFEPGWSWDECIKPVAGTDSCQVHHVSYVVQGNMKVKMNDGTEKDIKAGDVVDIPPGHQAWVTGNEACVMIDIAGPSNYGKSS